MTALRPSEKLKTKHSLYVWIIFALCLLPFTFLGFIPELGWVYVLIYLVANAIWIAVALVLIPPYCRSISYELGEEEIVVRKGIITQTVQTVPYRTITNLEVKRGPLDRMLGMGGIHIQTAGYSQQSTAEARLVGLEDYEQVADRIYTALRRYRAPSESVPSAGLEEPSETGRAQETLERILATLQSIARRLQEGQDS